MIVTLYSTQWMNTVNFCCVCFLWTHKTSLSKWVKAILLMWSLKKTFWTFLSIFTFQTKEKQMTFPFATSSALQNNWKQFVLSWSCHSLLPFFIYIFLFKWSTASDFGSPLLMSTFPFLLTAVDIEIIQSITQSAECEESESERQMFRCNHHLSNLIISTWNKQVINHIFMKQWGFTMIFFSDILALLWGCLFLMGSGPPKIKMGSKELLSSRSWHFSSWIFVVSFSDSRLSVATFV